MNESFAKISSVLESARDLTIEAAVSASARLTETPSSLRPQEISNKLNSRLDRDIISGLKCVISLITRGEDGLPYFADVIKNVSSSNNKIRNLVLIYITKYAEIEPDTALLSINSIQKSLSHKSPINRATAIKSLCGMRISSILPILLLCIKRTSTDPSPIVRSATAIAIGKVYEIEGSNKKQLLEYLFKLMDDANSQVISSALKTYYKVLPDIKQSKKWVPIHGNFRRYCTLIKELDEWSQSFLIDIFSTYVRLFLPRPKLYLQNDKSEIIDMPDDFSSTQYPVYDISMDADYELFINSFKSLVYSPSEVVILTIAKSLCSLAPPGLFKTLGVNFALTRIAISSTDSQTSQFALQIISHVTSADPSVFSPQFKKFLVYPNDSFITSKLKLQILTSLVDESNIKFILQELKFCCLNSKNKKVAVEAVRSICRCSQISPKWNSEILHWCLLQTRKREGAILSELLNTIRCLVQQRLNDYDTYEHAKEDIIKATYKLSLLLINDEIEYDSDSKSSIIWIIGEFTSAANNTIGPDILRKLIPNFADEEEKVRYQILILASKIYTFELDRIKNLFKENIDEKLEEFSANSTISKMFKHVLLLAKYDDSYDTRDRARMISVLLNQGTSHIELASLFLQAPKPPPLIAKNGNELSESKMHLILLKYLSIVEWSDPETLPDPSIRKESTPVSHTAIGNSFKSSDSIMSSENVSDHGIPLVKPEIRANTKPVYNLHSLDEFFGSEVEASEEESEEESQEESEEEEEEEDDDDDDDDEELGAESEEGSQEESEESEEDSEEDSIDERVKI